MPDAGVRIFPFLERVIWKIEKKFILPELYSQAWEHLIKFPWVISLQNAGLLELIFIQSILESFNKLYPDQKIDWAGSEQWMPFLELQGLIRNRVKVDVDSCRLYPLWAISQNQKIIWQPLVNYLRVESWDGTDFYSDRRPVPLQILEKSCLKDFKFIFPRWRNEHTLNIKVDLPDVFLLFILNSAQNNSVTKHSNYNLSWNNANIIKLANERKDLFFVVISDFPITSHFQNLVWISSDLINNLDISSLIKKSDLVFSNEIDWAYYALVNSSSSICTRKLFKPFNFKVNARYLERDNEIIEINSKTTPVELALLI